MNLVFYFLIGFGVGLIVSDILDDDFGGDNE